MGYSPSTSFGLYFQGELISVMSVKRKKGMLEIIRFASKIDMAVQGGFSKLLSHIEKIYRLDIMSFCDRRYSSGKSYLKCGFKLEGTTLGWSWTDKYNKYHRMKCRANMDSRKLSQAEHASELQWYKLYDAGQDKYTKKST